jgi:SAM-dependent methyltransferase
VRDAYRGWRYERTETPPVLPADAPPLPPARLVFRVAGTFDRHWFLEGGRRAAHAIRALLAAHGVDASALRSVLDFGCGCGRVLRHLGDVAGELHGCDHDAGAIAWCRRHLAKGRFAVNALHPPLPYRDGQFDLVYALSVFTHLPERMQGPWMQEMARVLASGGHLVLSLHGAAYADQLTEHERRNFEQGRLVVRDGPPGSNLCAAYHPPQYVREVFAEGFTLLETIPEGAAGNPRQDLLLLRKS